MMRPEDPIVYIVDDDSRVRDALCGLIEAAGMRVVAFDSGSEFLAFNKPDVPACLILDLNLPGLSGLEIQQELLGSNGLPVIFISGHGDVPSSVRAMKAGAIDFLTKPFGEHELLNAIAVAVTSDTAARQQRMEMTELEHKYTLLTPREQEVCRFVVAGFANKEAGAQLGITEATVGVHRGQVMRKMRAGSLAELVRMADRLGIIPAADLSK